MTVVSVESTSFTQNPLDLMEEIVAANDWVFERASHDEMLVEVAGRWCNYRLFFFWQDEISAMQFSCQFDMKIPAAKKTAVCELLATVNERMWLGHFDVDGDEQTPMFRHTTLLRGNHGASVEMLEDLVDITLTECERFYPAFQFVVWGGKTAEEAVAAAILDTVAEA
ncbi:MAG TPA: YbjN domain-containing protein [Alphaproteobacteria bacterium]|nr:YbjN domain-containing protein [Alphaproteobacteria bacterium]